MMGPASRWEDLFPRLASGTLLLLIGLGAVAIGQDVFHGFIAVICGIMIWELVGLLQPNEKSLALGIGSLVAAVSMIAIYLPMPLGPLLLFIPPILGLLWMHQNRWVFLGFVLAVLYAGFGMMSIRDDLGFIWMLWLVLIVVVTDIAGYFVGRLVGGPKLWPKISPKKTWSGTIAGWIAASVVGLLFAITAKVSLTTLIILSAVLSIASQLTDIAESAIKRQQGAKDSSDLIPGHGGLLDRFDSMLGASVAFLLSGKLINLPMGFH